MPISQANRRGLLRLLEDDDMRTVSPILDQLAAMSWTDLLTIQAEAPNSPQVQRNLHYAHQRNIYQTLGVIWQRMCLTKGPDLLRGLILISSTVAADPGPSIKRSLSRLAGIVGDELAGDRAIDNGLEAITRALGRFHGATKDYYAPENAYLHSVLRRREGIPITLACVAILIGRKLELPVHGIATPGHFVGYYGDPEIELGSYFDPFNSFRRVSLTQVQQIVARHSSAPLDRSLLRPASDGVILARVLNNLINMHSLRGEAERVHSLTGWLAILRNPHQPAR